VCVCVCVRVCLFVCVRVCVCVRLHIKSRRRNVFCASARVCVRVGTHNERHDSIIRVPLPNHMRDTTYSYGVASICRLLKIISLVCKRALQQRRYSAKETYNFKEPTSRRHPIRIT